MTGQVDLCCWIGEEWDDENDFRTICWRWGLLGSRSRQLRRWGAQGNLDGLVTPESARCRDRWDPGKVIDEKPDGSPIR